ncbi:lipoprotein [Opitutus sp. ER46]|uniref:plastocyanin/azurin family copper-binding protein n=1 Tax=Opitutus sp. ER46 TaxID=2161864 RepID=UPI000D3110D9|nr:lipoprotein [Opitutus sp. ER46]PTX96380.1 azurin [Opitutus sp. ER46]
MKIQFILVPLALVALSGCGQKGPATSADGPGHTAAHAAGTAPTSSARTIEITANDQMKYSLTTITAAPGEELRVVLTNAGSLPKEAMGHNWVLIQAGMDPIAFGASAAGARETQYIPTNQKEKIIAHIDLLGPRQTGEVTFKAPAQPGTYPFLCTFPGHAALMRGTLTVE